MGIAAKVPQVRYSAAYPTGRERIMKGNSLPWGCPHGIQGIEAMSRKVFVSYKYKDMSVKPLKPYSLIEYIDPGFSLTRVYVDYLADIIELSDHIYKGEETNNDLSGYSDEYIEGKLKERISDSSVTIVLISPKMRVENKKDRDQWIPWEISYSLKEIIREDRTSHTNALLGVVLPAANDSYDYCISKRSCCSEHCRWHNTYWLFEIIRRNTFNRKSSSEKSRDTKMCDNRHERIYYGEFSYMPIVTWAEFIENPTRHIERVCDLRDNHIDEYDIQKVIQS